MKKLFTGMVTAALVAALAVPAFAGISDTQKKEISDLYSKIGELRKEIVQKYVDAGEITKEQGTALKENIDRATEYQEENSGNAGPGLGCGGYGMMGGYGMGAGYGGMMGGYDTGAGYGGMMGGYGTAPTGQAI